MKTKNIALLVLTVLVVIGIIYVGFTFMQPKPTPPQTNSASYKTGSYMVDGQLISLVDGVSEIPAAPGSTSKITTRIFGNEAFGDVNADGKEDVVFLLTQNLGGSGTFFYVATALKTNDGYLATNTVFLGDRIAPQTTQINNGVSTVNYADRKPGEAMTTSPSVGVSKYFKIENGALVEQIPAPVFGSPVTLLVGKTVQFSDGLTVTLNKINDSRCKAGVVCIWAGELSATITASDKEFTLGETTKKSSIVNGYTFTLTSITEASATIVVGK